MNGNNGNVLDHSEVNKLLENVYKDLQIRPKQIQIDVGSNKGDGYMSFLTRVDITTEDGAELHLVMKSAPRIPMFRKITPIRDAFLREILFYEEVVPTFRRFQIAHSVETPFDSIPRFFHACKEDGAEVLVLENIKTLGFKLWDRMKYMDPEHIAYVMRTYGKFHALSYAMQQKDPESYEALINKMPLDVFRDDNVDPAMMEVFLGAIHRVRDAFENEKPELYKILVDYDAPAVWKEMNENHGEFPVICHGDCWVNNMMFKYDDLEDPMRPTDIRLLDFQIMKTGSPVLDLSYFFYVSATKTCLDQLDRYLRIYHDSLSAFLKEMDCEVVMSFEGLKREWKFFSKFGFNASLVISKMMMSESDEVIDFVSMSDNTSELVGAFNKEMKHDEFIAKKLNALTLHMYENGFI